MDTAKNKKILIIGGGISGLSLGALCIREGWYVEIREKNDTIGGLLADYYDEKGECYVSWSGPHIMNFSAETREAREFISEFTELIPFDFRALCIGNGSFTYWPVNSAYQELFDHLHKDSDKTIFSEFIESYSRKMWGDNFQEVIENIKDRFSPKDSRNNLFFEGRDVYIPKDGYSNMMQKMSQGVVIKTNESASYESLKHELSQWDYVVSTSHIDDFFNKKYGELEYEGIDFTFKSIESENNLLPTPMVNLNTHSVYTRISEMNQFYNSNSRHRVICFEKPSRKYRFYPVQTKRNKNILEKYIQELRIIPNVISHGRLGGFKYKDMDDAVQDSINLFKKIKSGEGIPQIS